MASCGEFDGLRAASLYGDLTPAERKALDAHLAGCAACLQEIKDFQAVLDVLPPPSLKLSTAERERILRGTRPLKLYRWIAVAAAAASLLVAAVLLRPRPTQPLVKAPPIAERPTPKPPPPPRTNESDSFVHPPPATRPVVVPEAPKPPTPAPEPEPVPVPIPKPPPVPRPTVAAIAKFEGKDVFPGDTLSARGRLLYGDGTDVLLGPGTSVREETGPEGKRLQLLQGEIRAKVAKQPAGQPLRIVSGEATAVVLGTVLRVARSDADVRLEVHEGRVRLDRAEGAVEVQAGRYIEARPGRPAVAKPLRATLGLAAFYTFSEIGGRRIHDRSGVTPPLDLTIGAQGRTLWGADGLSVNGTPLIATDGPAERLVEACRKSNALTLEAWIRPARPMLGFDGAILALSSDNQDRNFALVQGQNENGSSAYEVSLRTSTTNPGGDRPLASPRRLVEPELTHVVFVRSAAGVERLYVNGVERSLRSRPGSFATWNAAFRLELGDERTQERPWSGTYRLVAVYSRALAPAEVKRNFIVGADGW